MHTSKKATLALAIAAADKRASRKEPLTRREALAEAPWAEEYREHCTRREWSAAYADRLIERGLALPTSEGRSGPSGPSGKALHPPILITGVNPERRAAWDRAAQAAGLSRSEWAREHLDRAAART